MLKQILLASIAGIAGYAPVAQAQAQTNNDDSVGVTDIIVTAQRKSENLQDVPIAITAIGGDALRDRQITDTSDLAGMVPSLQVTNQLGLASAFLRGIGTSAIAVEGSVATYIDGVYLPSQAASLTTLNNVERVEVLKGPQGTLFGRNSTGGVIQVVTRDPSHTPTMDISLGYGNYQTISASGYVSGGISDTLAADLAVTYSDQGEGWGHNFTTDRDILKSKSYAMRSKWVFEPSDATKITLALDMSRIEGDIGMGQHVVRGSTGLDGVTGYTGYYDSYGNFLESSVNKQKGAMLRIEQDLGGVVLVSISAYRTSQVTPNFDQDATPLPIVDAGPLKLRDKVFTQEVQLQSDNNGPFSWIIGGYYFRDRYKTAPFKLGGAATAPFPFIEIYNDIPTTSYAAFGQGSYAVTDATKLTAGIRYTRDEKGISGVTQLGGGPITPRVGSDAVFEKVTWRLAIDHELSPDVLAYVSYNRGFKAGVYEVTKASSPPARPETLDAYEVGLKSELFGRRLRLNLAGYYYDFQDIQLEEKIVGGTLISNAAKAKIYGLDLDLQAALTRAWSLSGGLSYTHGRYKNYANAAAYYPVGATVPAGVVCDPAGPTGNKQCSILDASGKTTVKTPEFTLNLATDYRIETASGNFVLNANYAYNDGFFWNPDNRLKQKPFHLVGGSLGWEAADRSIGIRVWGKNLLKEQVGLVAYAASLGDLESPGAPRTYGVTLTSHF